MNFPKLGPVIAVDGPAGTGKSSATHRLAEILGFKYMDTGALYRSIAFLCLKNSDLEIKQVLESAELRFVYNKEKNPKNRIFSKNLDLTDLIRTVEVSAVASKISQFSEVRLQLLRLQREWGSLGNMILEGRDIGTVVFPDADIKFFLFASLEERAKRRLIELELMGRDLHSFEEVKMQIFQRDQEDSLRALAPLKKAVDAIEIDTSHMLLDEVVNTMYVKVKNQLKLSLS